MLSPSIWSRSVTTQNRRVITRTSLWIVFFYHFKLILFPKLICKHTLRNTISLKMWLIIHFPIRDVLKLLYKISSGAEAPWGVSLFFLNFVRATYTYEIFFYLYTFIKNSFYRILRKNRLGLNVPLLSNLLFNNRIRQICFTIPCLEIQKLPSSNLENFSERKSWFSDFFISFYFLFQICDSFIVT